MKRITNQEFKDKVEELYPEMFDLQYCEYINNKTKIVLVCRICGKTIEKSPHHLLTGKSGCKICSGNKLAKLYSKSTLEFIQDLELVHFNKFNTSNVEYINSYTKINLTCNTCSTVFDIKPNDLLNGHGCSKCANIKRTDQSKQVPYCWTHTAWEKAGNKSNRFTGFKLYIIKCYNEDETFYKIGKTFTNLKSRFYSIPYSIEILKVIENDAKTISMLEVELKSKVTKYIPKKRFGGMYECCEQNPESHINQS